MNRHAQTYFTTGEFAARCGVTKHTLFHYDQLGIFSPVLKEENGYRFYSYAQIEVFHVISTLKELDIPLKEIKAYLDRRSPEELTSERGIALAVAAHVQYCNRHDVYSPHPIGGMISLEMVRQGAFDRYSHFYTQVASPPAGLPGVENPAGTYPRPTSG